MSGNTTGTMVETRSNTTRTQDPTMESLNQTVGELQRMMTVMRIELSRLRSGEGNSNGGSNGGSQGNQNMSYTRATKIEFPKFGGDDVRGWLYKCEQFFRVDHIPDDQKVALISIHLFEIALMWHRQFLRFVGENVDWIVYKTAILKRFGSSFDDPMADLKNVKYETTMENYQNEFDKLLSRVVEY